MRRRGRRSGHDGHIGFWDHLLRKRAYGPRSMVVKEFVRLVFPAPGSSQPRARVHFMLSGPSGTGYAEGTVEMRDGCVRGGFTRLGMAVTTGVATVLVILRARAGGRGGVRLIFP